MLRNLPPTTPTTIPTMAPTPSEPGVEGDKGEEEGEIEPVNRSAFLLHDPGAASLFRVSVL